jgi:hypothetical protein
VLKALKNIQQLMKALDEEKAKGVDSDCVRRLNIGRELKSEARKIILSDLTLLNHELSQMDSVVMQAAEEVLYELHVRPCASAAAAVSTFYYSRTIRSNRTYLRRTTLQMRLSRKCRLRR